MSEGRQKEHWAHTSAVLAMLVNVNRASRDAPTAKPSDFDPFARKREAKPIPKVGIGVLKSLFVNGK